MSDNKLEARLELLEDRVEKLAITVLGAFKHENKAHFGQTHYTDEALREIQKLIFEDYTVALYGLESGE